MIQNFLPAVAYPNKNNNQIVIHAKYKDCWVMNETRKEKVQANKDNFRNNEFFLNIGEWVFRFFGSYLQKKVFYSDRVDGEFNIYISKDMMYDYKEIKDSKQDKIDGKSIIDLFYEEKKARERDEAFDLFQKEKQESDKKLQEEFMGEIVDVIGEEDAINFTFSELFMKTQGEYTKNSVNKEEFNDEDQESFSDLVSKNSKRV